MASRPTLATGPGRPLFQSLGLRARMRSDPAHSVSHASSSGRPFSFRTKGAADKLDLAQDSSSSSSVLCGASGSSSDHRLKLRDRSRRSSIRRFSSVIEPAKPEGEDVYQSLPSHGSLGSLTDRTGSVIDAEDPEMRATLAFKTAREIIENRLPASDSHEGLSSYTRLPSSDLEEIFRSLFQIDHPRHQCKITGNPNDDLEAIRFRSTRPKRNSQALSLSILLLSRLREVRHPRTRVMYYLVLLHAIGAERIDKAAEIYVGLVEEWILEGRVAEGGRPEDFAEGGGPKTLDETNPLSPSASSTRSKSSITRPPQPTAAQINRWFEGVRTWRMPGETLSPSSRLNLWHPKKLALSEKMRNFPTPLPTSPPTLVPAPDAKLLQVVVQAARKYSHAQTASSDLSPTQLRQFQSAARALAILANTILSRTLPITCLRDVIKAFKDMPHHPPVYPRGFLETSDPKSDRDCDRSAYTAYTHVHHALISLLLSPPTYPTPELYGSRYRLLPLGLSHMRSLIRYAAGFWGIPSLLTKALESLRKAHSWQDWLKSGVQTIWKALDQGPAADSSNSSLSTASNRLLPGGFISQRARDNARLDHNADLYRTYFRNRKSTGLDASDASVERNILNPANMPPQSILSHIKYLTRQEEGGERLRMFCYRVMPFLDVRLHPPLESLSDVDLQKELARRRRAFEDAVTLPPNVFSALMKGLANSSSNTYDLVSRIYYIAKRAERRSRLSEQWTLPVDAYTALFQSYINSNPRQSYSVAQLDNSTGFASQISAPSQDGSAWRRLSNAYATYIAMARRRKTLSLESRIRPEVYSEEAEFFRSFLRIIMRLPHLESQSESRTGADPLQEVASFRRRNIERVLADMQLFGHSPAQFALEESRKCEALKARSWTVRTENVCATSPQHAAQSHIQRITPIRKHIGTSMPCFLSEPVRPVLYSLYQGFHTTASLAGQARQGGTETRQAGQLLEAVKNKVERYASAREEMEAEGTSGNQIEIARLMKELEPINRAWQDYQELLAAMEESKVLLEDSDPTMRSMAEEEIASIQDQLDQYLKQNFVELLLPATDTDRLSAILEIKAGVGGDEAALFVEEVMRMYTRYAAQKGWKTAILSKSTAGVGYGSSEGLKEVTIEIKGEGAFGDYRFERGVHRVQRVPQTESQGRIHTSTIAVVVLPLREQTTQSPTDDVVDEKDVKSEVMRARGAGGQHVNKTESAIRLTHIPTGITVSMQDSRSQHQNRAWAWEILRARLLDLKLAQQAEEKRKTRRSQVKGMDRSDKVRTYNFPQSRITDHRIGLTLNDLEGVLEGEGLEYIIDQLRDHQRSLRIQSLLESGEDLDE